MFDKFGRPHTAAIERDRGEKQGRKKQVTEVVASLSQGPNNTTYFENM